MAMKVFSKTPNIEPVILNESTKKVEQRTIILFGLKRSGTSALAALLDGMGIDMDGSFDGHYERKLFKNPSSTVSDYNKEMKELNVNDNWGVQLEVDIDDIDNVCILARNPFIIVPFRDVAAIYQRLKSVNSLINFFSVVSQFNDFIETIEILSYPLMLVSYERLKNDPNIIIDHISTFLDMEVSQDQRQEAISRISKTGGYISQNHTNGEYI